MGIQRVCFCLKNKLLLNKTFTTNNQRSSESNRTLFEREEKCFVMSPVFCTAFAYDTFVHLQSVESQKVRR